MTEKEAGVWVSDPVEFVAGDEFKVRANGEWKKDFGADCVAGGSNIVVEADGVYIVTLDLNAETLTFAEKGPDVWTVIGGFEGSSWSTDINMTEIAEGVWESDPIALKAGDEFKVRANADWAVNFGITEGATVQDGNNIKVEADGTYVITLDLSVPALTWEMK